MIGTQIRKVRRKQRFGLNNHAHRTWTRMFSTSPVDRGITYSSIEKNHLTTTALQSPLFTLFLNGIDYRWELVTKDRRTAVPARDSDYSDDTQLYCPSNPNGINADLLSAVAPHRIESRRLIH